MNYKMNTIIFLYIINVVYGRLGDSLIPGADAYNIDTYEIDINNNINNELYFPRNIYTISKPISNEINITLVYIEIHEHLSQVKNHLEQVKSKFIMLRLNNNETIYKISEIEDVLDENKSYSTKLENESTESIIYEIPDKSQLPLVHRDEPVFEIPDLSYKYIDSNIKVGEILKITKSNINNIFINMIKLINYLLLFFILISVIKYISHLLNIIITEFFI